MIKGVHFYIVTGFSEVKNRGLEENKNFSTLPSSIHLSAVANRIIIAMLPKCQDFILLFIMI